MKKTELYFGRTIGNNKRLVTDQDWEKFRDDLILPAFPFGCTILEAVGYWQQQNEWTTIQERTKIVVLVYDPDQETDQKIETIIEHYKEYFEQESVLRVDYDVRVTF